MPGASDVRAGGAYVELYARDRLLMMGLSRGRAAVTAFAAQVTALGHRMAIAGALISVPFVIAGKKFIDYGDQVGKAAKQTGTTTEFISEMGHAADISGSSLEAFMKGFKKMAKTIDDAKDGLTEYIRDFDKIGIGIAELEKMNPEEVFLRIAKAVGAIEDPLQKAAIAQSFFGRAGMELIPLLNEGEEGIRKLRMEADRLGLSLDTNVSAKAEATKDALSRLKGTLTGLMVRVGEAMSDDIIRFSDSMGELIIQIKDWAMDNKEVISSIAKLAGGLTVLGLALSQIVNVLKGAIIGVGGFLFLKVFEAITGINTGITEAIEGVRLFGQSIGAWVDYAGIQLDKLRTWITGQLLEGLSHVNEFLTKLQFRIGFIAQEMGLQIKAALFDALAAVAQELGKFAANIPKPLRKALGFTDEKAADLGKSLTEQAANIELGTDIRAMERKRKLAQVEEEFNQDRIKMAKNTKDLLGDLDKEWKKISEADKAAAEGAGDVMDKIKMMAKGIGDEVRKTAPEMKEAKFGTAGTFAGGAAAFIAASGQVMQRQQLDQLKQQTELLRNIENNTAAGAFALG